MKTVAALVAVAATTAVFADEITGIGPVGKVKKIQGNFKFTEGPAWDGTSLFFTDIPATTIYRLDSTGNISAATTDSKHANGLMIPTSGGLLACQMDGQLVRYSYSIEGGKLALGKPAVLAKAHAGKRFNAPNDLVIDKTGGIFFTDPRFRAPMPWPQKVEGVYYVPAGGEPKRILEHRNAPNGVILSPDEKTLYVVHSASRTIMSYAVTAPGKIDKGKPFAEIKQPGRGNGNSGGDGLTVDVKGNLYVTTRLGVQVFDPKGKRLGIISFPEVPANCTFGGKDLKTLYVTARTGLYSVKTKIPGHRFPGAKK